MMAPAWAAQAAPATRARDFTEALERAKSTGSDIVVLQRGSDWNRLGETLNRDVWQTPGFAEALGEGFVLVTVDRPEQAGAPALGTGESRAGLDRFLAATTAGAKLPDDEVASVRTEGGANFKKRGDGSWLLDDPKGEHNPAHDTVELNLRATRGGQVLRIDFLPDSSLPNGGSGRASNGNFALNEVSIVNGDKPVVATHAWGNSPNGTARSDTVVVPASFVNVTRFSISSGHDSLNGARAMPQFSFENEFSQTIRSPFTISR